MNSKERVLTTIRHKEPDRVPLGIWLYQPIFGSAELKARIEAKYGSLDSFYDTFEIDLFMHILPFPYTNYVSGINGTFMTGAGGLPLEKITAEYFRDPDDESLYIGLQNLIDARGRNKAIIAVVWGALEGAYSFMGFEATLTNMATEPERMADLFRRVAEWSARVARNAIAVGADIVQISADAGAKTGLLFSPTHWWNLVYPNDKLIADAIKQCGKPVAMHNDGNIWQIMDDIVQMGVDLLHPLQTSAGMDLIEVKKKYGDRLTIYGGLDISHMLPMASDEELVATIKWYMQTLKPGGGFIFQSEHFIPANIPIERLELAYATALRYA